MNNDPSAKIIAEPLYLGDRELLHWEKVIILNMNKKEHDLEITETNTQRNSLKTLET